MAQVLRSVNIVPHEVDPDGLILRAPFVNLYVPGDLIVVGGSSYHDVYISLNDDFTAGAPTEDGGLRIRRGASPYAGIFWDESEEYWRVCTSTDGTLGGTLVDKPIAALAFSASNFFILRSPYGASTGSFYVDGTSVRMAVDASIQWSSTTDGYAGAKDVGLARASAGVLKVTDGGAGYGTLHVGNGTNAAPSYSFASATGYGMRFNPAVGTVLIHSTAEIAGTRTAQWALASGISLVWTNGALSGAVDTGLARVSAGVLKVTDGSTGYGTLYVGSGDLAAPSYSFAASPGSGMYFIAGTGGPVLVASQQAFLTADPSLGTRAQVLGLAFGTNLTGTIPDLFLQRDAANVLAQRNGTNAQTFRVYYTYTDASNGAWGEMRWSGSAFRVGTNYNGTGAVRVLAFTTGGTDRWQIDTNGHFLASTDNTYDIGASGATRPRSIYWGTQALAPDGSAGAPAFASAANPDSGIFFNTVDLRVSRDGSAVAGVLGANTWYAVQFDVGGFADVLLNRKAAATLHLGGIDAASPVAQTLGVQGSRGGTDTDVAGANFTIRSGIGTGAAAASSIIFQTPTVGASGTTAQTMTTRLTISATGIQSSNLVGAGSNVLLDPAYGVFIINGRELLFGPTFVGVDTAISRKAAATIHLGSADAASPIAQTLGVQGARDGTDTDVAGASLTIRSGIGTGAGAASTILFQTPTAGASGTTAQTMVTRLTIAGNASTWATPVIWSADNTYDIGASGATRPRTGYFGTSLYVGASQWLTSGSSIAIRSNGASGHIILQDSAGSAPGLLTFGGLSNVFPALKRVGAELWMRLADDSGYGTFGALNFNATGGYYHSGVKVLGAQGAAVADASGGATVDAEARTAINDLLARLRTHGLIAT